MIPLPASTIPCIKLAILVCMTYEQAQRDIPIAMITSGLDFGFVPGPFNLFQNTPVGADGEILRGSAPTKAGDYVEVRAEMPIYLILTACSYDLDDVFICGTSTPLLIEVFP
jgi:uncharacterized protein YcgI (DUF1989 family)